MRQGSDVPGRITRLPGGVAMNIAMALVRFGLRPAVLTAIGRDAEGAELVAAAHEAGIEVCPLAGTSSLMLALAASDDESPLRAFELLLREEGRFHVR